MSFYINKIKKPTPPLPNPVSGTGSCPQPQPGSLPEPTSDEIKEAKKFVKESNMPTSMWKIFVLEIINEHPEISKFIKDYLGS